MPRRLDDATRRDRANAEITRTTEARHRMDEREQRRQIAELNRYADETERFRQQALAGDLQALRHYVNRSFNETEAAAELDITVDELREQFRAAVRAEKED